MPETAFSAFSQIDLASLASPDIVEPLDHEATLAALKADVIARAPELEPALALESEPIVKLLEAAAYREMLLRSRINQAARAVMLAHAAGGDLDQIAANLGVVRLEGEPDASLRRRAQLAQEAYSSAGPRGAYIFHALSADPRVRDIAVASPEPGQVLVTVLSSDGDGAPAPDLIAAVDAALNEEKVRPLTDLVMVEAAEILTFEVDVRLVIADGPDPEVVRAESEQRVIAYEAERRLLGRGATRSGLIAAAFVPGVERVDLVAPAADPEPGPAQSAAASTISVTQDIV